MKIVKIISATSKPQREDTIIYKSIEKYNQFTCQTIESEIILNNTEALAHVYNREIVKLENRNKILLFVHDDCIIEDLFLREKLHNALEQFDIVGLAGIKSPIQMKQPCLWHLMGPATQYSGAVAHFDKEGEKRFMTSFGKTPERVILLDGVFLAINTNKILEKGLRFDENNPAKFHFYDLNFSIDANKLGLKCGTYPIWVTHVSHGLEQVTPDWINGQTYFLAKN